ncbi:MAG: biotin--[acetyl-CoA-carboxylase] ligase [Dehalococcoidales bacterium]|nr:biotin--[acetyl-CoA-carboxylase] ligase [Dehalococcoidales bacterium]MDZ4230622.1 biotin--[acetyl-CoA-carboxylase] ligase [Dehalococcoidales bacterium]
MSADGLSAAAVTEGLETRFIGQRAIYFPSLTSTMDIARQEARQGAAEGTVIIADEQTAGRGRLQRAWLSPGGSIAVSVILRPPLDHLPSLVMLASLSVVHSIKLTTGLKAQIKWPNDVLLYGKKVCGILIENDLKGRRVNHAIIGIGINVNLKLSDFPEIRQIATSLSDELGGAVSRLDVLRSLLVEMERLYLGLSTGGTVYEEWRDNLVTLGKRVRVTTGEGVYEGTAEDVARDGSLLVRGGDGKLNRIVAGDVTLRGEPSG